jgi:HSP20 family protein
MITKRKKSNGNMPSFTNMLENFFDTDVADFLGRDIVSSTPDVNVSETNNSYKVDVAAPGLKKEDFQVNLENNILTISVEKETENLEKDEERFRRREFSYTNFERSFTLPDSAETEKIEAKYENGILKIRIPKKEMAIRKPAKTIKID